MARNAYIEQDQYCRIVRCGLAFISYKRNGGRWIADKMRLRMQAGPAGTIPAPR